MWLMLALLLAAPARTDRPRIRPEALRAHMRFLADDLLEGREAGTRGYELAAAYVASQLESYGLEPAFASGAWFQPVPLRTGVAVPDRCRLSITRGGASKELVLGEDYVPIADLLRETTELKAPIVFVGFGVSAPHRGYDDYASVDVKGRLVLLASGAPALLPSEERAYFSGPRVKRENAAAHGAIGILGFLLPADEERFPWSRVLAHQREGITAWVDEKGGPEGASAAIRGIAYLSRAGAETVLAGSPHGFDEIVKAAEAGQPQAFEVGASASLRIESRSHAFASPNVVGLLRGSDPKRAAEAIVLSAHLDHIGVGEPQAGDAINNGAFDNASGVASLLETARALSRLSPHPKRSILFAALTAEEKGLLGSDYLAVHPPLPLVADVNMDMSLSLFPPADVLAFGAEHSSLGESVARAASDAGLLLSPDPFPRESVFIRSDQYCFARRGVPAVMLMAGLTSRDPKVDGAARFGEWLSSIYHSPRDDMSQPIDFAAAALIAEVNLGIARRLADAPERPSWKPGDFFGKLFGGLSQ
jgi:hypothetical protein